MEDIRDWIASLDSNGLLHRHAEPTDVRNCSEIIFQNYKSATYFEQIEGYANPVLANSISSRRMMALALDTSERDVLFEYYNRISEPLPPLFADAPGRCQEKVLAKKSEVDLTSLPILLQHEFDGAPYISAGVVVAKDPETSIYNIGIYRLMFRTKSELGINITAPHKLRWIYEKSYERNEPLEIAVCLGLHPLDLLAAVTSSPEGMDELALWGGLQKEAIKLVKCKTVDLYVPDHAEIVLEATMEPTGWTESEGMYGEFPGTYSGMRKNPVVNVQAITSRKDPIYQSATHGGKHLAYTDFFVIIPQIELSIFQALKAGGVDVKQVRIVEESAGMLCYFSIHAKAIGDSRNALNVALTGSRQNFPKYAIVVDSDIDVFDDEALIWALSTRSQPKEDAIILDGLRIPSSSDPSLAQGVRAMSKLGIDATIPFGSEKARFVHSKPPAMEEYPSKKEDNAKIDEGIITLLRNHGPCYFSEIAANFPEQSFRSILLSWSRLRERDFVQQDMDGKYSIKNLS